MLAEGSGGGPRGTTWDGCGWAGLLQQTGNGEGWRGLLAIEVNGELHDASLMKILTLFLWRIVND